MKKFKVTFADSNSVKFRTIDKASARSTCKFYSQRITSIEEVSFNWWLLIYPALIALGVFAFYQMG